MRCKAKGTALIQNHVFDVQMANIKRHWAHAVGINELSKLADNFPAQHNLQLATRYLGFKYAEAKNIREDNHGRSCDTNLEFFVKYTNRLSSQVTNVRETLIQVLETISFTEGWIASTDYEFLRVPGTNQQAEVEPCSPLLSPMHREIVQTGPMGTSNCEQIELGPMVSKYTQSTMLHHDETPLLSNIDTQEETQLKIPSVVREDTQGCEVPQCGDQTDNIMGTTQADPSEKQVYSKDSENAMPAGIDTITFRTGLPEKECRSKLMLNCKSEAAQDNSLSQASSSLVHQFGSYGNQPVTNPEANDDQSILTSIKSVERTNSMPLSSGITPMYTSDEDNGRFHSLPLEYEQHLGRKQHSPIRVFITYSWDTARHSVS